MNLLRRIRAFVIRDFQLALSYRVEFFIRLLWILGIVTTFYFISRIFAANFVSAQYEQWQNPLVAWLTGMAMLNYFMVGFSALANAIRQEQMQGTLESVLLTPINVPTVIVSSSAWSYVEATFNSFLYLFFGWLFFNVQYKGSFLLALVVSGSDDSVSGMSGNFIGEFCDGFQTRRSVCDSVGRGNCAFFGRVFSERNAAGQSFGKTGGKIVAAINPSTHGLEGIRGVLIQGKTLSEVETPLIILLCFLAVLLPFSLWVFSAR